MESSSIRIVASEHTDRTAAARHARHGRGEISAQLLYHLACNQERLEQQLTDLGNRLAAVERRLGALEEPLP